MRTLSLLILAIFVTGCTTHIAPYRPKKRKFNPGTYGAQPAPPPGSLYAQGGHGFFEDDTATRVGDILVVLINERESASRDASTKLAKKSEQSYAVPASLGILGKLQEKYPGVDPTALFGAESDNQFQGSGNVSRKGQLSATLPVQVRQIMPNGDLYVEGTKVVMVGVEEHHIYVSGIVRRRDVSANNTVSSSRIAAAEIEYTGRGDVSDQQRQGWLGRIMNKVWPF